MVFTENDRTVFELALYTDRYVFNLYCQCKDNPSEDWLFPLLVVSKAKALLDAVKIDTSLHFVAKATAENLSAIEDLCNRRRSLVIMEWDKSQGRTNLKFGWKRQELDRIKNKEINLEKMFSIVNKHLMYDLQIMMAYKTGLANQNFEPDKLLL